MNKRYTVGLLPAAATMARRKFEIFKYRMVLTRLHHSVIDRQVARTKFNGCRTLAALRQLAPRSGWLEPDSELPF